MKRRRRLITSLPLVVLVVAGLIAGWQFIQPHHAKAATPANAELLMIHGYSDSCDEAFDYSNNSNYSNPFGFPYDSSKPFAGIDAWSYFNNHGWSGHIDKVGYYRYSDNTYELGCNHNATNSADNTDVGKCSTLPTGTYTDDPIRDIACKVAWYIYDNYSQHSIPVYVLAHSMGGLVIRDAIAESGRNTPLFPPNLLDVPRVVTLGTPHGGLSGAYVTNAVDFGGNTQEVRDMTVGDSGGFMQMITPMQAPQGLNGTYWALLAGSNYDNGLTGEISSFIEGQDLNNPYPTGDGVIQADSALSMQANYKILYGKGLWCLKSCVAPGAVVYTADSTTQYSHEADSCSDLVKFWIINITGCLATPFYLNDDSSAQTRAWICSSACNAGTNGTLGTTDMQVIDSNDNPTTGQPAPHSLAEILSLLPAPPPPPTPTPTNTPVTTCSSTIETDNNEPGGTYTDNRGNTWHVYYDIKRDSVTNRPCQMRVVVRIFNPAPDGTWHGTLSVFAEVNGGYDSASFGKLSSSSTYQYHLVWRGPWFTVGPNAATYHIEDTEYNGSNSYLRAYANFSV